MAKEELITVAGKINEIVPDRRFGVALDNEHQIIAYTAGKTRRHRIRSVFVDHVHVEMTPYDLTKDRIIYRKRTHGQEPGVVRAANDQALTRFQKGGSTSLHARI